MKLLFENWRKFVKQEVEEFLPHGEVRAVEKIGSSVLPPEEQAKQDLEKYGYVRDEDDRDIDIEVQIAHITNEEAEEWAFSREAQELEDYYNYDVQLRIVENWRKFMNEGIFYVRTTQLLPSEELGHGKNDEGYDTEQAVAEKMQQIQQGKLEPIEVCNQKPVNPYRLADKSMEKSGQAEPFYYVLDGHHRLEAINRLGVERVPVYLTNKEINETISEEVSGKEATGYHATSVTPDKFQKIFRGGAFKSGEGKEKAPGYGAGLYVLIDPNPESKTMMGHYGPHIYKFDFSLDDFIIFDPELSEQVYGKNTSIADQLRAMGKGELVDDMVEQMKKQQSGEEDKEIKALRTREALEAPLELVLQPDGKPRLFHLKAQNYANLLQPHVNGMVFTAGSEEGTIAVLFKPEVAKLTGYTEYPGNAYMDGGKPVPLGPGVGEKWLDYTTKQIRQKHGQPDWEPNEYMLNKAKSYSEFPNFRPLEEAVDPKMKKYLKKHPYMEPDQLQEEAAGQCFPFAVEMANAVPDNEFDDMSKFKVVHGRITDKFSGETTLHAWVEKGDVVFDWQTSATKPKGISKVSYYDIFQPEVHAEYTAEELLVNCVKQGHKGPFNLSEGKKVKIFRAQPAFTKVIRTNDYITMSRKFAGDHAVTSAVYNDEPFYVVYAFVDENDIKEADNPGEYLYIGEPFEAKPSQMATPEGDLSFIRGRFNEESEFQTKMKKNLPAELDFLLNKGPNNKKEGPGVKNPKKPKFKSAPPGAEGG